LLKPSFVEFAAPFPFAGIAPTQPEEKRKVFDGVFARNISTRGRKQKEEKNLLAKG
jgi:hypothetical protein